jgi:hypothetical protein
VPYFRAMLNSAQHGSLPQAAAQVRRPGVAYAIVAAATVLVAGILLAAAVLWIHYGSAVFFEMIATGLAACF